MTARITSKGQLAIPKEIRRTFGVRVGERLLFEIGNDSGEVRVRVARKPVSFAGYAGGWEGKDLSAEEVNSYVRDLRGHEDRRQLPVNTGVFVALCAGDERQLIGLSGSWRRWR